MHEAALGDGSFPLKKEEMNNMTTNLSKEVMETLETSFKDNKTRNAKKGNKFMLMYMGLSISLRCHDIMKIIFYSK